MLSAQDRTNLKSRAIDLSREVRPKGQDFTIGSFIEEFAGGIVAIVDSQEEGSKKRDFVYFPPYGSGPPTLYKSTDKFLGALSGRLGATYFLRDLLSIPGIIAIGITVMIGYLVFKNPAHPQIPEVLSGAFTLILGFYFGRFSRTRTEI